MIDTPCAFSSQIARTKGGEAALFTYLLFDEPQLVVEPSLATVRAANFEMRRFIARQNIRHFERLLGSERDGRKRETLERLLSDARYELAGLESIWSWTCPHIGIPDEAGVEAEKLLDLIARAHQADFASLQLWDDASRGLCLVAHRNFDRRSAEQFAIVRDGDGTVCEAARALEAPVIIDDIEEAEAFVPLREWTRSLGIRAIHTTPVFDRSGNFVGVFSTHYALPRPLGRNENEMNAMHANRFGQLLAEL